LQPAVPFVRVGLGDVEAFPRRLVDVVLGVDEPAGGEADELLVEELNGFLGIDGGAT
jgi:hypothetical protein